MAGLTIGRLARETDVNKETIRYYQRIGLLKEPEKPNHGYRIYPDEYIGRIRFIKRAQQLGLRLGEIAELLDLDTRDCADMRRRAEEKKTQINAQIQDLQALRSVLDQLIEACRRGGQVRCPIIDALQRDS